MIHHRPCSPSPGSCRHSSADQRHPQLTSRPTPDPRELAAGEAGILDPGPQRAAQTAVGRKPTGINLTAEGDDTSSAHQDAVPRGQPSPCVPSQALLPSTPEPRSGHKPVTWLRLAALHAALHPWPHAAPRRCGGVVMTAMGGDLGDSQVEPATQKPCPGPPPPRLVRSGTAHPLPPTAPPTPIPPRPTCALTSQHRQSPKTPQGSLSSFRTVAPCLAQGRGPERPEQVRAAGGAAQRP